MEIKHPPMRSEGEATAEVVDLVVMAEGEAAGLVTVVTMEVAITTTTMQASANNCQNYGATGRLVWGRSFGRRGRGEAVLQHSMLMHRITSTPIFNG